MTTQATRAMAAMVGFIWTFIVQPAVLAASPPVPEWTPDLVIYEIAPKAFTSPNGPESGTFDSLRARLPYLQELGITGIWLAGHAVSDPHHFYNIWSSYATIEPDRLDPTLGTPEQFRAMIAEAHRRGIKVFLDVTTHGLMATSPLIQRHPQWFRGGTWGMIDYDWYGGQVDLDDWWVQTWTDYVVRDGVDGFRIDINMYRPDLWARVRQNAATAGHPIVIFEETNDALPGVSDFNQQDTYVQYLAENVPAFFERRFGRAGKYQVKVQYADGTSIEGSTDGHGALPVRLDGLTTDKLSRRLGDYVGIDPFLKNNIQIVPGVPRGDGVPDIRLSIDDIGIKEVSNLSVEDDIGQKWSLRGSVAWNLDAPVGFGVGPLVMEGDGTHRELYLATLAHGYLSIQLSCHDYKKNYIAEGSRSLFGYGLLFAPGLAIFMSGEEFNVSFHPLPNLSPDVFGGKNAGRGEWLYGSQLDWNELKDHSHRRMFDDVKRMLAIRKRERPILAPEEAAKEPALLAIPYQSDIKVPVPYMRWKDAAAIVVMANNSTTADAHLKLRIPIDRLGPQSGMKYRVTDLWKGTPPKIYSARAFAEMSYTVERDKTPAGGMGLLKIERIP